METNINNPSKNNGKTVAGVIILIIGSLLLFNQLEWFFVPDWLLSWPMILIGVGLYTGARNNFRKNTWGILMALGFVFLITENIPNSDDVVWPAGIIALGAWMIYKHSRPADAAYPGNNNFKQA